MNVRRTVPGLLVATVLVLGGCKSSSVKLDHDGEANRAGGTSTTTSASGATTSSDSTTATTEGAAGEAPTSTTPRPGPGTTGAGGATTGAGSTESTDPNLIELVVNGGAVEGGVQTRTVERGAQVTLRVTSDTSDVVHVHGYDLRVDVVGGQSADLTFLAKSSGTFVVELEKRGRKLLDLQVKP